MPRPLALLLCLLCSCMLCAQDSDHDGLSDEFEQHLLEKFQPQLMISREDCAVAPAFFQPDGTEPVAVERDGTIYGQAFVRRISAGGPVLVELHYYDLWEKDCGRMGHLLDAEHVSVLVTADGMMMPASAWKALYWYAAAHEDTVCDSSTVAPAAMLQAEDRGARVWVSAGKHAAYLEEQTCRWGCGGDRCREMEAMPQAAVVNLGELGAPMNGAKWIESGAWPLREKFATDFPDEWMARTTDWTSGHPVQLNAAFAGVKGSIYGANAALDGAGIGQVHTGSALVLADRKTENALSKSASAVGKSLQKSKSAVGRFLRGGKDARSQDGR